MKRALNSLSRAPALPPRENKYEGSATRKEPRRLSRDVKLKALSLFGSSLRTLAEVAGTDKGGLHDFTPAYERFFSKYRGKPIKLLEIGVGGYDAFLGGHSLRLWEAYFRRGTIVGVDIHDKTALSRGRVHVHQCSQVDAEALRRLSEQYGGFDVIIDDGSHLNKHQIDSFGILFPLLNTPGIYVIEDTQTSYWPAFGGGNVGTPEHATSAVSFFKGLIDGLNHAESLNEARETPSFLDTSIRGIYFEHNLIVVCKGDNSAPSNIVIELCGTSLSRRDSTPNPLSLTFRRSERGSRSSL